jgi:alkylhydroperoxidase family enzyme
MAFIKTIRAKLASGAVHEMYARQEDHWGYVPNYAKVFSHRPEVMARWGRLLSEIRRPAHDRRFELVTFVAARQLKNSSCSMQHGKELAKIIGEENVIALANHEEPDVLSTTEIAIVKFVRDVIRDATKVTSGQVAALKEIHGLSDEEIFDIAAIASARSFFTKILDALGSEPDVSFLSVDKEVRQSLSIGRPISVGEPEHVQQNSSAAAGF